MSRRHLALVLTVATAIAALGSHLVASWLKVKTAAAEPFTIGKSTGHPPAFLAASSVGGYGILWDQVATQLDTQIKTWGIAGGSPVEFEPFQKRIPEARTTFIVVSTIDLDEGDICDFRAAILPLGQTIESLRSSRADWKYSKLVLTQYPMTWFRTLFPTLGRSRGLMGAALIKIKDLFHRASSDSMAGPTIKFGKGNTGDEYIRQKLSDWPESKVVGKLLAMQVDFQDDHSFNGAKKQAFGRMLQYADQRGRTVVIVMPLSAAYSKKFMTPELVQQFEAALAEAQQAHPRVEWLRLDQVGGLGSNANFCDLVHMNVTGQKITTDVLLARLKQPAHQP